MLVHPERLANVHPKVQAAALAVAGSLDFDIGVPADGGTRDDATQARLYQQGVTNAPDARSSPHGCGCAGDLAPYDWGTRDFVWDDDEKFQAIADAVEAQGMVSGRNFTLRGGGHDPGHMELPDWQAVRDAWRQTVGLDPSAGGVAVTVAVLLGAVAGGALLAWWLFG